MSNNSGLNGVSITPYPGIRYYNGDEAVNDFLLGKIFRLMPTEKSKKNVYLSILDCNIFDTVLIYWNYPFPGNIQAYKHSPDNLRIAVNNLINTEDYKRLSKKEEDG